MEKKIKENKKDKKLRNKLIIFGIITLLVIVAVVIINIINSSPKENINQINHTIPNYNQESSSHGGVIDPVKPIIYIYPTEELAVNVKLGNLEKVSCIYPKYDNGWNVIAKPNGDLTDVNTGRKLYALYWEGKDIKKTENDNEGFVIEGKDTASFLEEKLSILGLNEREAEEFIVYWLPKMESNNYNYIRFESMEEINKNMPLEITPTPETLIRVLMEFKPLNDKIDVQEQQLTKQERKGYTVVEWGGTELK